MAFWRKSIKKHCKLNYCDGSIAAELEHVKYKGTLVGEYAADLLVNEKVIVELKVAAEYNPKDEAQLLNQLKATEKKVVILINFGKEKVEFKRFVYKKSVYYPCKSVAKRTVIRLTIVSS